MIRSLLLCAIALGCSALTHAQSRVAVLPFKNVDQIIERNVWCLDLADSLTKAVVAIDPTQTAFTIIPADSIEMAISELNLDPTNPQYQSDVWKALAGMGAQRVVEGNFAVVGERVLMNVYVYDIKTKLAHPDHKAKNLYKPVGQHLAAVQFMATKIHPALLLP